MRQIDLCVRLSVASPEWNVWRVWKEAFLWTVSTLQTFTALQKRDVLHILHFTCVSDHKIWLVEILWVQAVNLNPGNPSLSNTNVYHAVTCNTSEAVIGFQSNLTQLQPFHNANHVFDWLSGRKFHASHTDAQGCFFFWNFLFIGVFQDKARVGRKKE